MEFRDPSAAVAALVREAVVAAYGPEQADVDPLVRRSQHADLQADVALGLARRVKAKPRDVATALTAAVGTNDVIDGIEIAGPGFLNITLKSAWLARTMDTVAADARFGVGKATVPERVVIDYSAPNVAKEMHVGHLRSTVIGDSLARVLEFRGHDVVRQNHIGDWGTPFGMLIEHFFDLGEDAARSELAVGELSAFYKAARQKFDSDPAFAERSRRRVVALQSGDAQTLAYWRQLVDLSIAYFESVYQRLGITMSRKDTCGESFYNPRLVPLAEELEKSGAAEISDGALCLYPPGFKNKEGEPLPLIVRKRDGGFGYATTDLAAIRYRVSELKATRILYVIGSPQAQHVEMFVAAARKLGWLPDSVRAQHVAFGQVLGTDKKAFKSRSGDTVRLIDLIDEAEERARASVSAKAAPLTPEQQADVARMLGIGSIKYADLSSDRVKDYVFDLDRMISFEGNTAGYVQYAHARIRSVYRKAEAEGVTPGAIQLGAPAKDDAERALVIELLGFEEVVKSVEESLEPHKLATYAYNLALAFTKFYERCPILKAEPAVRSSRLTLAGATAKTLAKTLDLLGIEAPQQM